MADRTRLLVAALVVALALVFVLGPFPVTQLALIAGFAAGWAVAWARYSPTRPGGRNGS